MEVLLSVFLGIGLAAAAGLRIFVPLLIASLAALSGHLTLSSGFAWLANPVAAAAFGIATVLELAAYKIPWLDNLLDVLGAPVAVTAGTVLAASTMGGMSPSVRWTLALIAGGGAAGLVHGATALTRKASSLTTGGLANPVLATAEAGGAVALSALSIVLPILGLLLFASVILVALLIRRRWRARRAAAAQPPRPS